HQVRAGRHQGLVFATQRLALGAVGDHDGGAAARGDRPPLDAGRERGAAAPDEAALLERREEARRTRRAGAQPSVLVMQAFGAGPEGRAVEQAGGAQRSTSLDTRSRKRARSAESGSGEGSSSRAPVATATAMTHRP